MFQGNWKCSTCGGPITELPFEPRSESGLTCRTCYMKQKDSQASAVPEVPNTPTASEAPDMSGVPVDASVAGEQPPAPDFAAMPTATSDKPRIAGDWKCANCGATITSLPFTPRDTSNLKCIDCFKKSRA